MFIQRSFEEELFNNMKDIEEQKAVVEASEKESLILEAMQELNEAAKKFKQAGLENREKEVTRLMISIAGRTKNGI